MDSGSSNGRIVWRWIVAWIPFAILWAGFSLLSFEVTPRTAALSGINAIGWAALLSAGVVGFTGRLPWPAQVKPGFYLAHVAAGVAFAALWLVLSATTGTLIFGGSVSEIPDAIMSFITWRLLTGLWLYGLVAGVSYAVRIRDALGRQERAAAEARTLAVQAQLDGLRARLNPHFFFNALNALSGLIHQDPDGADDALDRIGRLLRRALATEGTQPVTLAAEWDFTREYLDLERLRLGGRLEVSEAMDPGTLDCLVPAFTLQPLVENAVLHAVAPRVSGGLISVSSAREDGRLVLTVRDDGPGVPAQPTPEGHGLDLLARRLEALYGASSRVRLKESPGGGCTVTVDLPAQEASE